MLNRNLNVLSVVLLLAGCGGGDFSTAGLEITDGTGGAVEADAGAAGATQGTGGVTGVTGGQAAVTGGSVGTGGNPGGAAGGGAGGQLAGSGGDPGGAGGAATGGASGGSGAGGVVGTCKPPVVTAESLPQQVVWASYEGRVQTLTGDVCLRCQQSPCTTCSVTWWPVTQSADGLTVTATATMSCEPIAMNMGSCSSDLSQSSCTTWENAGGYAEYTFSLLPKLNGTGYSAKYRVTGHWGPTFSAIDDSGLCSMAVYHDALDAADPAADLVTEARDILNSTEWPCGQ